jgi:hypothetical protein
MNPRTQEQHNLARLDASSNFIYHAGQFFLYLEFVESVEALSRC